MRRENHLTRIEKLFRQSPTPRNHQIPTRCQHMPRSSRHLNIIAQRHQPPFRLPNGRTPRETTTLSRPRRRMPHQIAPRHSIDPMATIRHIRRYIRIPRLPPTFTPEYGPTERSSNGNSPTIQSNPVTRYLWP